MREIPDSITHDLAKLALEVVDAAIACWRLTARRQAVSEADLIAQQVVGLEFALAYADHELYLDAEGWPPCFSDGEVPRVFESPPEPEAHPDPWSLGQAIGTTVARTLELFFLEDSVSRAAGALRELPHRHLWLGMVKGILPDRLDQARRELAELRGEEAPVGTGTWLPGR